MGKLFRSTDKQTSLVAICYAGWMHYLIPVLWGVLIFLIAHALYSQSLQFYRLTLGQERSAAIDLLYRYHEVHDWFAGNATVYTGGKGVYPPASYVLLWPFLGWLSLTAARWFWAITSVVMLAWLIILIIKVTRARSCLERSFLAVLVLSFSATGETIGLGQLIVHILPPLLTGFILLQNPVRGWGTDCVAATLILWSLVQPTISVPFFWIVMFAFRTWRPAILVVAGYVVLTLFAASFQGNIVSAIESWIDGMGNNVTLAEHAGPYANVHTWLFQFGIKSLMFPASLSILVILGIWVYRHRQVPLWLILGVTAVVARFWTYHRHYNNLVILIPMITLFILARSSAFPSIWRKISWLLFSISVVALLTPFRVYYQWSSPWPMFYKASHIVIWFIMLVFLLCCVYRIQQPIEPDSNSGNSDCLFSQNKSH